jgi:hypothetical protein
MPRSRIVGRYLWWLAAAACSGDEPMPPQLPVPTTILTDPTTLQFSYLEETRHLSVTVQDQSGRTMESPVAWNSPNEAVASIDPTGLVTARGPGSTTLLVEAGAVSTTVPVVVTQVPATVAVEPDSVVLQAEGDTLRLTAVVLDSGGSEIGSPQIAWQTGADAVATVDETGLVRGVGAGGTSIRATSGAVTSEARLWVRGASLSLVTIELRSGVVGIAYADTLEAQGGDGSYQWLAATDALPEGLSLSRGGVLSGVPAAEWHSVLPAALVSGDGQEKSVELDLDVFLPLVVTKPQLRSGVLGVPYADSLSVVGGEGPYEWSVTSGSLPSGYSLSPDGVVSGVSRADGPHGETFDVRVSSADGQSAASHYVINVYAPLEVADEAAAGVLGYSLVHDLSVLGGDGAYEWSFLGQELPPGVDLAASGTLSGVPRAVGEWVLPVAVTSGDGQRAEATVTLSVDQLNLVVESMHLNQGNQSDTYRVPAIAGRAGALRVFVSAGGQAPAFPDVLLRLYRDGQLLRESLIPAPSGGVVGSPVPDDPSMTWNLSLSGDEVGAGLEVEVVVDPSNSVSEADETDNRFPSAGGRYAVDVVDPGPLDVMFVPIQALDMQLEARIDESNLEWFLSEARSLLPVGDITARIREPLLTDRTPVSVEEWEVLLSDIQALRTMEQPPSSPTYYHGIVNVAGARAEVSGLAYLPTSPSSSFRSAVSWDRPSAAAATVAHELGHNLGRGHAPCGNPQDLDLEFPYPDGTIGGFGYDAAQDVWITPDHRDFMSYCLWNWTSDYTFSRIVDWRLADPTAAPALLAAAGPTNADRAPGLLAWGRLTREGVELNPLIELEAPTPPPTTGENILVGYSDDGAELFRVAFEGTAVADVPDGEEHFALFIPLPESVRRSVGRVEVTSRYGRVARVGVGGRVTGPTSTPGVSLAPLGAGPRTLRWDQDQFPMMVLRDRLTGEVLGIFRQGSVELPPAILDGVDVSLTDGVRTQRVEWR